MIEFSRRPPTPVIISAAVVIALALAVAFIFPPGHRTPDRSHQVIAPEIAAADLLAVYGRGNPPELQRYAGPLNVTGAVDSAARDPVGFIVIYLAGDTGAVVAQAQIMHESWDRAAQLDPGERISVYCVRSYPAGDMVGLSGCRLN